MNIHHDDPRWTAYVLGELQGAELEEVERELKASAEAREIVDEIRMMTTMLKDELVKEAPAALRPAQREAVRSAIVEPVVPFWKRPWFAGGFAAAAAAAVIFFAVAMPYILRNHPAPVSGSTAETAEMKSAEAPAVPPIDQETTPAAAPVAIPEKSQARRQEPAEAGSIAADSLDQVAPVLQAEKKETASADLKQKDTNMPAAPAVPGVLGGFRDYRIDSVASGGAAAPSARAARAPESGVRAEESAKTLPWIIGIDGRPVFNMPMPGIGGNAKDKANVRPRLNTESYDRIEDNPFKPVAENPLATFSVDVDTASYANMRRFLNQNQLPPKDSVRIEELINYFNYDYPQPSGRSPIGVYPEVAPAPWAPSHQLVRIGVKARDIDMSRRPPSNLVFLIDVSGSMMPPERLPLLKNGLKLLVDRLGENDRVTIVVYAGSSGVALPTTTGDHKERIIQALDRLEAGGSTNGGQGIQLAYDLAVRNFIKGGVNRVILCTDGDFNVGITNQGDLTRLIEDKAKSGVFLSVLGFGTDNLKDSTMEKLADKGNGNYSYIDSLNEARKVLLQEMGGTLIAMAKDVKIQVDFNPAAVSAYRLIGYENRVLQDQDFNDDTKDAGDMGAGQTVTALFEIVPRGVGFEGPGVDPSKYTQSSRPAAPSPASGELLTVRVRYKLPDAADSSRLDVPVGPSRNKSIASTDFSFAAAVAEFGMVLRESPYKGQASLDHVLSSAEQSRGADRNGYRDEFIKLVRKARALRDLRQ